jgi:hypothetical protein
MNSNSAIASENPAPTSPRQPHHSTLPIDSRSHLNPVDPEREVLLSDNPAIWHPLTH